MTTFFISRHPGARNWAKQQRLTVDQWVAHLDIQCIEAGDRVIGTLPVNLAAEVCARGAQYVHLSLQLPAGARGRELSAAELTHFGANLQVFDVTAAGSRTLPGDMS